MSSWLRGAPADAEYFFAAFLDPAATPVL